VTALPLREPRSGVARTGPRGPRCWRAMSGAEGRGVVTRGVATCGALTRGGAPRGAAKRGAGATCGAGAEKRGGGATWGAGAEKRGAAAGGAMWGAGAEMRGAAGGAATCGAGAEMRGAPPPPPPRFSWAEPDRTRDGKRVAAIARTPRPVARMTNSTRRPFAVTRSGHTGCRDATTASEIDLPHGPSPARRRGRCRLKRRAFRL